VIVELGLPDYPLEASLGSHFFHNVTSMNVGYFSVPDNNSNDFVEFDLLEQQELIWKGKYVNHIRFKNHLEVLMDGRKRKAIIRMLRD